MSPFDPNYKSQLPPLTKQQRGHMSAARKASAARQAVLDRNGPLQPVTTAQLRADAVKREKLRKGSL